MVIYKRINGNDMDLGSNSLNQYINDFVVGVSFNPEVMTKRKFPLEGFETVENHREKGSNVNLQKLPHPFNIIGCLTGHRMGT